MSLISIAANSVTKGVRFKALISQMRNKQEESVEMFLLSNTFCNWYPLRFLSLPRGHQKNNDQLEQLADFLAIYNILEQKDLATAQVPIVAQRSQSSRQFQLPNSNPKAVSGVPTRSHFTPTNQLYSCLRFCYGPVP